MPKFDITKTPFFEKRVRELKKRFRNIEEDLDGWSESLNDIKELGVQLKSNVYKVRIANSDKNRGKSSGYRLITYLKFCNNELVFIYIYDKSDIENISENELDKAIMNIIN